MSRDIEYRCKDSSFHRLASGRAVQEDSDVHAVLGDPRRPLRTKLGLLHASHTAANLHEERSWVRRQNGEQ